MSPSIDLNQAVIAVQESLNSFFSQSINRSQLIDADYGRLWQNLHELSESGGKRLRPRMTIMSYVAFGGQDLDAIVPTASAQELLHFSLLIHDDIIDRDDVRYGVANITGRYLDIYRPTVPNEAELRHYSQSAAILGGDVIISSAYQIILNGPAADNLKVKAMRLLGDGIFDVCGGELLDTEAAFKAFSETNSLTIARYKTASYSFVAPLLTGASMANASQDQLNLLMTYAENLGVAYQLTDDLIGSFGDESITGKSSLGDIREAKHTFLAEQHLKTLNEYQESQFWQVFGNQNASHQEIDNLKQAMIDSGARDATQRYIDRLTLDAQAALDSLDLDEQSHANFSDLITKATRRQF